MPAGYMRVSKADGRQVTDLQRDSLLAAAIDEPDDPPRPITIKRPRAYRLLWYNLLAKLGFHGNPLGGFGGFLPMPATG